MFNRQLLRAMQHPKGNGNIRVTVACIALIALLLSFI